MGSFLHTFDVMGKPRPERQAVIDTIGYRADDHFRLFTDDDPSEWVRVYREQYVKVALVQTTLLPGAEDCLERLQAVGLKLAFATSKELEYAEMILEHLGILDTFVSRIGPGEVTHPKPHPEAVCVSSENLNVSRERMFFVGDTHFDVLAARAAQVRCLCVTTGYASREQLEALEPERIFDFLPELTDYVLAQVS